VGPGTLLVAPPREPVGSVFEKSVVLVVDAEPSGIVTGICVNRPLEQRAMDSSALALLFVPDPDARAFWGGPMGSDPAILAQFEAVDGLDWFHLPIQQRRPFPLPDIGVIAVAEHQGPFEDRIRQSRLYVGLCVWGRGQLQAELNRGAWQVRQARAEDVFSAVPERLWTELVLQ
jgi:putative transcriptional regulator